MTNAVVSQQLFSGKIQSVLDQVHLDAGAVRCAVWIRLSTIASAS